MSLHIPSPNELPRATSDFDADKYRKGRRSLGIGLLVMGAINGFALTRMYTRDWHLLATLTDVDMMVEVGALVLNVIFFASVVGCGIWNILARKGTSIAPLIVGLVVSSLALVFAVLNSVDAVMSSGRMPALFAFFIHVALLIQAIRLLRMKPVPPTPEPTRQSVHPFYQP
ncbi:hypothetical protein [Paenarthrobacter sp. NPDC058040]|uniref:hypothetical protein n=1 Tax=unclassified Paenarthrobacter TaxID=2634190 RepID=UPI0036DB6E35